LSCKRLLPGAFGRVSWRGRCNELVTAGPWRLELN
jgi:hypothetical protein